MHWSVIRYEDTKYVFTCTCNLLTHYDNGFYDGDNDDDEVDGDDNGNKKEFNI